MNFIETFYTTINQLEYLYYKYKGDITNKDLFISQYFCYKKRFGKQKRELLSECPYKQIEYCGINYLQILVEDIRNCSKKNFKFLEYDLMDKTKTNFSVLLLFIEKFCDFILFSDIALFFVNDDDNDVYAEKLDNDKKVIYFKFIDYKVKFIFEKTKIPNPNIDPISNNILSNNIDKNMKLIHIEIVREYGKKFINKCDFVDGETIEFKTKESEIMFTLISSDIKIVMINTFKSILQKAINSYFNINTIDVDSLINSSYIYVNEEKVQD